jgi:MerR family transcriptional regulator, light-induced transcriptional regulator
MRGGADVNDVSPFLLPGIPAEMVETFTHLVFSADGSDSELLIEQLLDDGVSAEVLMLDLLAPAARLMGKMWCGDEANFLEVTLGLSRIHRVLRQLRLPALEGVADRGSVLLAPVPGEQHVLGLRMVEEFLMLDGWLVRCTPVANEEQLRHIVATDPYDIVGFSVSGERLLPALRSVIREVRAASRNRNVRIMVGGVAFAGQERSALPIDADAFIVDAREAVAQAKRWHALAGVT